MIISILHKQLDNIDRIAGDNLNSENRNNETYFNFLIVFLESLKKTNPNEKICLRLFDFLEDEHLFLQSLNPNLIIEKYNSSDSELTKDRGILERERQSALIDFLIEKCSSGKEIIYMDVDVLVRGELKEVYSILENNDLAAQTYLTSSIYNYHLFQRQPDQTPIGNRINSGIMIFKGEKALGFLKKWKEKIESSEKINWLTGQELLYYTYLEYTSNNLISFFDLPQKYHDQQLTEDSIIWHGNITHGRTKRDNLITFIKDQEKREEKEKLEVHSYENDFEKEKHMICDFYKNECVQHIKELAKGRKNFKILDVGTTNGNYGESLLGLDIEALQPNESYLEKLISWYSYIHTQEIKSFDFSNFDYLILNNISDSEDAINLINRIEKENKKCLIGTSKKETIKEKCPFLKQLASMETQNFEYTYFTNYDIQKERKVTIYTTLSKHYFSFGKIFLHSIKNNFPENKLNKIIINDLGLSKDQKEVLLEIHPKLDFIKTAESGGDNKVWSAGWREAIDHKTIGLQTICKEENYPVVMIDSDTYVVKDFTDEFLKDCDIQVCRTEPDILDGGYFLSHIASWFVVNNDKGKKFIDRWRKVMPEIKSRHIETPALCETLKYSSGLFSIKDNDEFIVSSLAYSKDSKIIHFRSTGNKPQSLKDRISKERNLPNSIVLEIFDYLTK